MKYIIAHTNKHTNGQGDSGKSVVIHGFQANTSGNAPNPAGIGLKLHNPTTSLKLYRVLVNYATGLMYYPDCAPTKDETDAYVDTYVGTPKTRCNSHRVDAVSFDSYANLLTVVINKLNYNSIMGDIRTLIAADTHQYMWQFPFYTDEETAAKVMSVEMYYHESTQLPISTSHHLVVLPIRRRVTVEFYSWDGNEIITVPETTTLPKTDPLHTIFVDVSQEYNRIFDLLDYHESMGYPGIAQYRSFCEDRITIGQIFPEYGDALVPYLIQHYCKYLWNAKLYNAPGTHKKFVVVDTSPFPHSSKDIPFATVMHLPRDPTTRPIDQLQEFAKKCNPTFGSAKVDTPPLTSITNRDPVCFISGIPIYETFVILSFSSITMLLTPKELKSIGHVTKSTGRFSNSKAHTHFNTPISIVVHPFIYAMNGRTLFRNLYSITGYNSSYVSKSPKTAMDVIQELDVPAQTKQMLTELHTKHDYLDTVTVETSSYRFILPSRYGYTLDSAMKSAGNKQLVIHSLLNSPFLYTYAHSDQGLFSASKTEADAQFQNWVELLN